MRSAPISAPAPAAAAALNLNTATNNGAYLLYYGPGETVTRQINLAGTGSGTGAITIESSGSGPLVLSALANTTTGATTLSLRGYNMDPNTVTPRWPTTAPTCFR